MPPTRDVKISVDPVSLQWESIGELVRECTILVLLESMSAATRDGHDGLQGSADPTWN